MASSEADIPCEKKKIRVAIPQRFMTAYPIRLKYNV